MTEMKKEELKLSNYLQEQNDFVAKFSGHLMKAVIEDGNFERVERLYEDIRLKTLKEHNRLLEHKSLGSDASALMQLTKIIISITDITSPFGYMRRRVISELNRRNVDSGHQATKDEVYPMISTVFKSFKEEEAEHIPTNSEILKTILNMFPELIEIENYLEDHIPIVRSQCGIPPAKRGRPRKAKK